jgi:uncharacterized protein (DUF983 family)
MTQGKALRKAQQSREMASGGEVVSEASPGTGWRLRACPRCGGDLYQQWGPDDWTCAQCGWAGETRIGKAGRIPRPKITRRRRAARG